MLDRDDGTASNGAKFSSHDRPAARSMTNAMAIFSKSTAAALTSIERAELLKCEETVTAGIRSFATAGKALARIRDGQLYRESHESFEDYVSARWKMSRQHAHRLIEAAGVVANLSPTGDTTAPLSEYQARQLSQLTPDVQREVWSEVTANAPRDAAGKPVIETAAVAAAVAKRSPKKKRRARPRPTRIKVPGATVLVVPNAKFVGTPESALRAAIEKLAQENSVRAAA